MSLQLAAKKMVAILAFGMVSMVFLGVIFALTTNLEITGTTNQEEISHLSWIIIAYVAGLSMIALPCTLPLVFIIVPMTINESPKKGLLMALLFGCGLVITISMYGIAVAAFGQAASLDQLTFTMYLVAGVAAFVFGISQLGLVNFHMPSYSGMPGFISDKRRGDYSKTFFMGLLLGNAGVGCPNPLFYWLLIHIASVGSMEVGGTLGVVHGVGRAIPVIFIALLGLLGINASKGLRMKREKIEKITGWMLVLIGSLLIVNGIPGGHEWYEHTFIHLAWNNFISTTPIPPEFHVGTDHIHDAGYGFMITNKQASLLFFGLLALPVMWHIVKRKHRQTGQQQKH